MLKEFELGKSRVREVEELAQGHTAKERQRWDSDSGVCATWLCPSYAGKAERSFGFLGMSPSAMVSTQGGVGGSSSFSLGTFSFTFSGSCLPIREYLLWQSSRWHPLYLAVLQGAYWRVPSSSALRSQEGRTFWDGGRGSHGESGKS